MADPQPSGRVLHPLKRKRFVEETVPKKPVPPSQTHHAVGKTTGTGASASHTPNAAASGPSALGEFRNIAGIKNTSPAFRQAVRDTAARLGISPVDLMAVMSFESGGTFNPAQLNRAGSRAVGLIQFMPSTATSLGTTTAALAKMTPEQQMGYVEKYFNQFKTKLKDHNSLNDVYMAVLYPKAIDKDDSFALFKDGTTAYHQNHGLDLDENGVITKGEAAQRVRDRIRQS